MTSTHCVVWLVFWATLVATLQVLAGEPPSAPLPPVSTGDRRLYMGLETSEKIFVTYGLQVTNKGGHSSLPEPDNAIYRLAAGLGRSSIRRLETSVFYDAMLHTTCVATMIDGGHDGS